MSSQTEDVVGQDADAATLRDLGMEQLQELLEEHEKAGNDAAVTALKKLIDEREKLHTKIEADKNDKATKKSRRGTRVPKGRQVDASASFNADPENLARLKVILEGDPNHDPPIPPVIQADGSYLMSPWMVQLGISCYYAERRVEKGEAKAEAAPIIPESDAQASAEEPPAPAEVEAATSEIESISDSAQTTEDNENALVEEEPQAQFPIPTNPFSDEGDGESE